MYWKKTKEKLLKGMQEICKEKKEKLVKGMQVKCGTGNHSNERNVTNGELKTSEQQSVVGKVAVTPLQSYITSYFLE